MHRILKHALASASSDHTVKFWNIDTGSEISTLRGHANKISDQLDYGVQFNPDGNLLATAGDDNSIILWDFNLSNLLKLTCNWSKDYLQTNPYVSEDDKQLCQGIAY